ncbi:MAG: aldo/keto reductase [Actinomycetia bacterium]|nr:aldo/keto reductase [Actinomycetes bacterium]
MRTRRVGRSALEVSALGLGTLGWGVDVQPPDARALLRTFADAGGTLIDTAPTYGDGMAERMIGTLLRHDVPRDDVVLATKGGLRDDAGTPVVDTSHEALLRDLAGSLRRLGTDHVDLWQLHAWGEAPLQEALAALDRAVTSGMARYAGVCNYLGWQIGTAAAWQDAAGRPGTLVSGQNEYSLLARRAETEVLPALAWHGLGFFAWSPLGRGVLAGTYVRGAPAGSRGASEHLGWFVRPYLDERSRAVVDALVVAADGLGLTPAQVALLWVRDAPGVTAPLLGARTPLQLAPLLAVDDDALPDEITAALDDITGGPNTLRG